MPDNRRLLWTISFHHACNDGTLLALVALIPVLAVEMDLSYSEIGLLGFGLLITVIAQLLVGKYADRAFSRYLLEAGAALMGISFILMLFVNDFLGLFLAVISMRVGAAFYHPVGISWISREFAGKQVDEALGIQSGIGNLGVIIALGSTGYLAEAFDWRLPCLLWAGLNFAAVGLGLALTKRFEEPALRPAGKSGHTVLGTMRKIGLLAIPIVGGGALYQVATYFGPIRLTEAGGWTAGSADFVFAIWIGVGTLTSYYFGAVSRRFGKTRALKWGYAVSGLSVLALAVFTEWFLVVPIVSVFGALLMLTYPALFSVLTDITDPGERGTAFGILFGYQLGGGAAIVYMCGLLADLTGDPSVAFLVATVMSVLSLLTLMLWGSSRVRIRPDPV